MQQVGIVALLVGWHSESTETSIEIMGGIFLLTVERDIGFSLRTHLEQQRTGSAGRVIASGAMIFLLIWSPMSELPFSATMSLKPEPLGIVIGAKATPAYLSLTYLTNSSTRT